MIFKHSRFAIAQYLFKRLEMALGLALILYVAVTEFWLTQDQAIIAFVIVLALRAPSVYKGINEIINTHLSIDEGILTLTINETSTAYTMSEFKVLLFKKRGKSIPTFVVMNENDGIKLEYYDDMPKLFAILSEQVSLKKELPWWQRI